jgi:hypothetical protein
LAASRFVREARFEFPVLLLLGYKLCAGVLERLLRVLKKPPHIGPHLLFQPLGRDVRTREYLGARVVMPLAPRAGVVVIALAPASRGTAGAHVGHAALGAVHQAAQQIVAWRPPPTVALVLCEYFGSTLLEGGGNDGRDRTLNDLASIKRGLVGAGVGSLAYDTSHGGVPPARAVAAFSVSVPVPWSRHTLVVQPLRLAVECGASGDVGDYLAHHGGLLLDKHKGAV